MASFFSIHLSGLLLTLSACSTAVGQPAPATTAPGADYHVEHFTDENGLPQTSVKSIARDKRGNIWLATERGVARYDGHHFVNFDEFGDSFADRNVRGFYLNPKPEGEGFVALNHNYKSILISEGKAYLDSAAADPLNGMSIGPDTGKWVSLAKSLPDTIYTERPHTIALIFPCRGKKHFAYDERNVTFYSANKIRKVFPFPDRQLFHFFRLGENLYYLDDKLGVYSFHGSAPYAQETRTELNGTIVKDPLFVTKHKYELFWNNSTDQAFILLGNSLYLLQPDKNGMLTSKIVLEGFDLKANAITTIYYDHTTNRIFLGSQLNGLFVIEKKTFRAVTASVPVPNDVYYGQTLFDKNRILTAAAVLFDLRPVQNRISSSRIQTMTKMTGWDPYGILKDSHGDIWDKQGNQLFRFDSKGNRLLSTSFIHGGISLMYEGRDERIWIGTTEQGLYYIDRGDPKAVPHPFFGGKLLRNISWVQQQTERLLWIGTGSGLFRLDLLTKKIAYVKELENTYVRSLYIPDKQGEIWITTYSRGFYLLKNGKLTKFPLDKNQSLASAHCIVEDKNGFFWITTNRGLFQIRKSDLLEYARSPSELYYQYYSKTAGFNTNEFNGGCQPCALRAPNGTVSFPSIKGLVWFVPEQINPELPRDGIYTDEIIANGRTQHVSGDTVRLAPGSGDLVIRLNAPYFGNIENMRLFYKITRDDDQPVTEWIELDNQNLTITTPHLGRGNYTLSVCKKAGFGPGNYIAKKIYITVQSHWYETWWAKSLLILTVVSGSLYIIRRRVSKIEKQNQVLEAKVAERTEHLEKTLLVLNNSEKELEQRIRIQFYIIASISHDIRSPIRYMSAALEHIRELMLQKEYEKVIEITGHVGQASEKIYQIADNIVNFIRPEVYGGSGNQKRVNLHELICEKVALFDEITAARGASIQTEIDRTQNVCTDPRLLGIVIYNMIDNALKVADGIRIRIYTEVQEKKLHLVFQDQGTGMPDDLMNWLNSGDDDMPPTRYEGLGLLMVRQIAKLLRFSLHVSNTPGACISIVFEQSLPHT